MDLFYLSMQKEAIVGHLCTKEILGAIFFYFGFILPNWVKNFLLKEEKVENTTPSLKSN